jgi:SAM-dependent methyltransferase
MTEDPPPDPTGRFSNRVTDYVRFRPSYPSALVDLLVEELGIGPGKTVADVGSGTGILTTLLLDTQSRVIGVEPNPAMRAAAEGKLSDRPGFVSAEGLAEATGLEDDSVDAVTAAQAFHWFRVDETAKEFRRILRPEGRAALIWNSRPPVGSPFLVAYETFLEDWGTDYTTVREKHVVDDALPRFFGGGPMTSRQFANEQVLDYRGLEGRLLSSSYTPPRDDPRCPPMLDALMTLFGEHSIDGVVRIDYDTKVYYGRPGGV